MATRQKLRLTLQKNKKVIGAFVFVQIATRHKIIFLTNAGVFLDPSGVIGAPGGKEVSLVDGNILKHGVKALRPLWVSSSDLNVLFRLGLVLVSGDDCPETVRVRSIGGRQFVIDVAKIWTMCVYFEANLKANGWMGDCRLTWQLTSPCTLGVWAGMFK